MANIDKVKLLEEIKAVAIERGGECLSTEYIDSKTKMLFKCSEKHLFECHRGNLLSNNRWCPECGKVESASNRRQYTIEDMKKIGIAKGGLCLSDSFESVIKKLTWQCSKGHIWDATPHKVKNKTWCPVCAWDDRAESRKRYTIEDMQQVAKSRGGLCLSSVFKHVKSKLLWECSQGHQWEAHADNIIHGKKWCPVCAINRPHKPQDMHQLAANRGGKFLSENYDGVKNKYLWECSEGHQWEAVPSSIIKGGWCPECSSGLGERICRAFFEQLFDTSFKKIRPDWLRTPKGHQMELDGYSPVFQIAFEHQGEQHYKEIKFFKSKKSDLNKVQQRDQQKLKMCKANGILLIQVPSILDILGIENVKEFIRQELIKNNVSIPFGFDDKQISLESVYSIDKLQELRDVAVERKGKLISTKYLGIFEKLEWECVKGHQFKAAPNNVKNSGSWCPQCAKNTRHSIETMKDIALSRNGKCLSNTYVNNRTPLTWQCDLGHVWDARPANVLFGTWCPQCKGDRIWETRRKKQYEALNYIGQASLLDEI